MELELQFQGEDANEKTVEELEDWLRNEQIPGLVIKHKSQPLKPGEMGVPLIPIIIGPIAEVGKSIFNYLGMRRPRIKVKMKIGEIEFEFEAENLKNEQEAILNRLISVAESQRT